jgi:hypothetical protein
MLTHPTLDQLRALKLDGMADAFIELEQQDAAKDLTHAEWLALLLDREIANRATTIRLQFRPLMPARTGAFNSRISPSCAQPLAFLLLLRFQPWPATQPFSTQSFSDDGESCFVFRPEGLICSLTIPV